METPIIRIVLGWLLIKVTCLLLINGPLVPSLRVVVRTQRTRIGNGLPLEETSCPKVILMLMSWLLSVVECPT